eukprot:679464-Rhodomonas_salina.1
MFYFVFLFLRLHCCERYPGVPGYGVKVRNPGTWGRNSSAGIRIPPQVPVPGYPGTRVPGYDAILSVRST